MRNSFVKINKNDILFCGRTNAEIGIFVRYKAICDNFETDALTWEQICANFDRKERKVVSKLVRISPEVNPKLNEVKPKLVRSKTEVEQSKTEVSPKFGTQKDNKNNDIACARVNNIIPDETRLDETRLDDKCADAQKRPKRIFKKPTVEEIDAYCREKNLSVNPQAFFDYFEEGNWEDAKGQKVKNWKQKILTWQSFNKAPVSRKNTDDDEEYWAELARKCKEAGV